MPTWVVYSRDAYLGIYSPVASLGIYSPVASLGVTRGIPWVSLGLSWSGRGSPGREEAFLVGKERECQRISETVKNVREYQKLSRMSETPTQAGLNSDA